MAKVEYKAAFAAHEELYEDYGDNTTLILGADNDVISYNVSSTLRIVLKGDDFDLGSTLNSGMLESVTFRDADNNVTATIKGLKIDTTDRYLLFYNHPPDIQGIVEFVLSGADTVIGTALGEALYGYGGRDKILAGKGHDEIHGGAGRDKLTGGKGSDHFVFGLDDGKDVITDFDARGGGKQQDYIVLEDDANVRILKKGDDTLIRYGDGMEILLEGVHKSDVKMDVDIVFAI